MSTDYQTYSTQNYYPQNTGYPCQQQAMPQMLPMGSPMFQPLPLTGHTLPQVFLPNVQQFNCSFQAVPFQAGAPAMLPVITGRGSIDSLGMSDNMSVLSDLPPLVPVGSFDSFGRSCSPPGSAYVPMTPNGHMVPSYSPSPYPTMLPPMIGLIPANSRPTAGIPVPQQPQVVRNSSISVTEWDRKNIQEPVSPEVLSSDPNLLGYRTPSSNSVPRSRSGSPASRLERTRSSCSDYSVGSDAERDLSSEVAEPSKRELVNRAFSKLQTMFGQNFDQNGNRGENILRLKVKTRTALEQIVPFIQFCQQENLILSVSCPISTKKGRQQVRGFLAYLQMKDARDADRVEELIQLYNTKNGSPFNTWHRNPPSTWNKTQA